MDAEERADRVEELTWKVIEGLAMEALRKHKRDELPGWLGPRVATVVHHNGGTEDQARSVMDEILGLGPLEPLLRDRAITEIRITGPRAIEVVREGQPQPSPMLFSNEKHLRRVFERVVTSVGHELTGQDVDAAMRDGSKVQVRFVDGALHATILRPGA